MNLFGVSSRNRPEWYMLDYAACLYNYTIVPLYDTLGADSATYILKDTNMETLFVTEETIERILKNPNLHTVKNIVSFDPIGSDMYLIAKSRGLRLLTLAEVIASGK
jgi:long-chain acyl-CoA synthetase